MKKILMLAIVITTTTATAQTIRRVNNNFGVSGVNVYATPQAAHDAAAANDILIIEPSSTSYGNFTIAKPLKIYGNGYFLSTNTELKADQRNSTVGTLTLDAGSEGTEVYGLTTGACTIQGASNISIARCQNAYISIYNYSTASVYANVTGIILKNNYIPSGIGLHPTSSYVIADVNISNNIVYNISASSTDTQNLIVINNTIFGGTSNNITNAVVENNLFYNGGTVTANNTTLSYNVSSGTTFGGGIGNQDNVTITTEVQGSGTGISDDEFYVINAASTLKTAGNGGIEVGAFGGATPYVISGIPAIPSILNMINSGTGDGSNPLDVTISVKSNN
ncbi:MAG TPA: hypothetical protein VD927_14220 [Chryseosolibacter sp.]|nr:hypothetical protein [Chryseosolibacter sp.]